MRKGLERGRTRTQNHIAERGRARIETQST